MATVKKISFKQITPSALAVSNPPNNTQQNQVTPVVQTSAPFQKISAQNVLAYNQPTVTPLLSNATPTTTIPAQTNVVQNSTVTPQTSQSVQKTSEAGGVGNEKSKFSSPSFVMSAIAFLTVATGAAFIAVKTNKTNKLISDMKNNIAGLTSDVADLKNKIKIENVADDAADAVKNGGKVLFSPDGTNKFLVGTAIGTLLSTIGFKEVKHTDKPQTSVPAKDTKKAVEDNAVKPDDTKAPVSIWGDMYLSDLNDSGKISPETSKLIEEEIKNTINRQDGFPQEISKKDAHVWSVSYETPFNNAGGQRDIAEQLPAAFKKEGIDSFAVAPLFDAHLGTEKDANGEDHEIRTLTKLADGKYEYKSPCFKKNGAPAPISLDLVYEGPMSCGSNMRIFKGEVNGQPYLFLNDDKYFNYHEKELIGGTGANATVYASFEQKLKDEDGNEKGSFMNHERCRVAQFNNLTYEALRAIHENKDEVFSKNGIEAPNKIVAHEAWQSGGLLAKLRLFSIADEQDKLLKATDPKEIEKIKSEGNYLRDIADNTVVPIHNLGEAYQGMQGAPQDYPIISQFYNTIYEKFAKDMMDNSFIKGVSDENMKEIFGTPLQRIGFLEAAMNPAQAAVALATNIGPVSEGYQNEIVNKDLAGSRMTPLLQVRAHRRGKNGKKNGVALTPFPNGVDKLPEAASDKKIDQINSRADIKKTVKVDGVDKEITEDSMISRIRNLTGNQDAKVIPYFKEENGELTPISKEEYKKARENNKELFVALLKDAVCPSENSVGTPLVTPFKSAGFVVEDVDPEDIAKINVNTPIFSMASRMDPQKGFDTIADAYVQMIKDLKPEEEMPVLIMSGGTNGAYQEMVQNFVNNARNAAYDKGREPRIFWTKERTSNDALMLMNMATTNAMPSDFEPFGISDLKGTYAGSHTIVTEVGGMVPGSKVSNKVIPAKIENVNGELKVTNMDEKPNSITVKDYEFMCTSENEDVKSQRRDNNAKKLKEAMQQEMTLMRTPEGREQINELNYNALDVDVSWNKGAIQNYMNVMKIS